MKYLGRHLSFHDRYIKMQNKVYCHMSMRMIAELLKALFCNREAPRLNLASGVRLLSDKTEDEFIIDMSRKTNGETIIEGGGVSKSLGVEDRKKFLDFLFSEEDDHKLLHIIERCSMMQHLV